MTAKTLSVGYRPERNVAVRTSLGASISLAQQISGMLLVPLVTLMYSSPLVTLRKILQRKSCAGNAFHPSLLLVANCMAWTVYSVHQGVAKMYGPLLVNLFGLCVNGAYLAIFSRYLTETDRPAFFPLVPATVSTMCILAAVSFASPLNHYWGDLTLLINCLLFTGPLASFREAWKKKSVESMPVSTILSGLVASCNCVVFFACLRDATGLIPNAMGVLLSVVQMSFYAYIVRLVRTQEKKQLAMA